MIFHFYKGDTLTVIQNRCIFSDLQYESDYIITAVDNVTGICLPDQQTKRKKKLNFIYVL